MQHVLFLVAGVALVAAGTLLLRAVVRGIARQRGLETRLARVQALSRAQQRTRARLVSEEESVAALAASLPGLVRELSRGDLDPQAVPSLILELAEAMFRPEQVLLYLARDEGQGPDPVLQLAMEKGYEGYERLPDCLRTVPYGRGKIGWVALHKRNMLEEDWKELARAEGIEVEDNHPSARLGIAGPLVHQVADCEQTLGVLCLGSLRIRPRQVKTMFQLVTHLGSLALANARHLGKLRDMANTDALTGLPNKRWFMAELANLLLTAERNARGLSLLLLEIDGFKKYEDSHGHLAGERVLRRVAALLREHVRPEDRSCYYGGELFAVAMPGTSVDDALALAERIARAVERSAFGGEEGRDSVRPAINGGVAGFPADGAGVLELTTNADRALIESREAGGNRIARYRGARTEVEAREPEKTHCPLP